MNKATPLSSVYALCRSIGITRLLYACNRHRLLILTYHNIIPDEFFDDALHLGVSHRLSEFERQVDLIAERFDVTTDFHSDRSRSCVITFDDGYKNNIVAAEYLERKGIRGVFFVPVEPAVTGRPLSIDRILQWFSYVPPGVYSVEQHPFEIFETGRREAFSKFYSWMGQNTRNWDKAPELLDHCYPFTKLKKLPEQYFKLRFQPMSRDELARLRSAGHLVGCHSWNHRPLAMLDDEEMQADFASCAAHRDLFNVAVYSYPFGGPNEIDRRAIRACKSFGYQSAVTNCAASGPTDRMALPREALPRELSPGMLDAKLSGLEASIKRLLS
jgi:peptidoglycan/xylan/chitin deacetylase (PgdA/CDA1 family)